MTYDELRVVLPRTTALADRVLHDSEVDSTNAVARRMLMTGELFTHVDAVDCSTTQWPMAVIVADRQREGHGRMGRTWVGSPGESSMVSYVTLVPRAVATDAHINGWLQMIAGLASAEAIVDVCAQEGCIDCPVRLKWPNDIMLHGRKLGGILIELVTMPGPMVGMIFGVGINLGIPADRLPTSMSTSLQLHCMPLPDSVTLRDEIAARTVIRLRTRVRQLADNPMQYAGVLLDEMKSMCLTLGRQVEARLVDGTTVRGKAVALNPDASLTVLDASGTVHVITTGDVGVL